LFSRAYVLLEFQNKKRTDRTWFYHGKNCSRIENLTTKHTDILVRETCIYIDIYRYYYEIQKKKSCR